MLTRAQFLVEVRDLLDAKTSQRWNDTTLARLAGLQMRRDWADILRQNNTYRWAERTPTVADGTFQVTDLTTGTGATLQHFFRLLTLRDVEGAPFTKSDGIDFGFTAGGAIDPQSRRWWREGTRIRITPRSYAGVLRAYVAYYPALVHELGDNDTLDYPDGYEMGLVYASAALAFPKGGAEVEAAAAFLELAASFRDDMLADVTRDSTAPHAITASDSPLDWEG